MWYNKCLCGHKCPQILSEYAFLIAHSLLHLVGFDHMSPEDEEKMTDMQNAILDSLGITRDAG